MRLSDLESGERGVIVKVSGHGGFRKRILEMGFVAGQEVEVLLNAPLQDPVKYRIMGYEVSLRHEEAGMIEVDPPPTPPCMEGGDPPPTPPGREGSFGEGSFGDEGGDPPPTPFPSKARLPVAFPGMEGGIRGTISVALVGNPNCGKTSLFNFASGAHARVGNYSGVTVDATVGRAVFEGYTFELTDLPGTYSLSCYSPEELYVRRHLTEELPDVVINVVDASNLERNLYLTTQLVDMNVRMVCALNMFDEFERRGDEVDIDRLQRLMGVPMVPTSFKSSRGVEALFRTVVSVYEGENGVARHLHINYGHEIENGIARIQRYLKADEHIAQRYSTRYLAIKLLENDTHATEYIGRHLTEEHHEEDRRKLFSLRGHAANRVFEETGVDAETAIMDAKYGFIRGALAESEFRTGTKEDTYRVTHLMDAVLSNRYLGLPIFFLVLYVMFQATFSLGQYPMDWIDAGVGWIGEWIGGSMSDGPLRSMLVDGVVGGVGSVIVFLPQILILYFFISLMEDSGYMSRAAFIMDKVMHLMGLHGKSFIPLVMGFGCNVPAVMATRTIESRRSRLITMMILPFMSCSARLPIYIMIAGTFFAAPWRSWVMLSLYAVGIVVAVVISRLFSRFVIRGEDTPFVMELPPYRWPTAKAIGRHTWEKGKEYLKKMGGIILVASIIVWALSYFGGGGMESSYLGRMGRSIEPVFALQGFNWKMDVSLIAGVGAKEIVASTMGVLYSGDDGLTPLTAYAYLLFILLYFPCIATLVAIKNETGSWRWALFAAAYTTCVAWFVSAAVVQIGRLFC